MTVHHDPRAAIKFGVIKNATGKEREIKETPSLNVNPVGTFTAPYILTMSEFSGIDSIYAYDVNIYPNPARDRMFIEGDVCERVEDFSLYETVF